MATRLLIVAAVVLAVGLLVLPARGGPVLDNLVMSFDAVSDTVGSDGWDGFLYDLAGNVTEPIWLDAVGTSDAPEHMTEGDAQFFRASQGNSGFSKENVGNFGYTSWSWEIWLRRNGGQFGNESQVAGLNPSLGTPNFIMITNNYPLDPAQGYIEADLRGTNSARRIHEKDGNIRHPTNTNVWQGNYEVQAPLDTWQQVVFTYQDATGAASNDGVFRTYINGQKVFELTDEPSSNIGANATMLTLFATTPVDIHRNFNGDIAIFRWYLASLTPEQVAQNFQNDAAAFGLTQKLTGDANGDGKVNDDDLSLLLANWQQNVGWEKGNFNGDTIVNDDDLSLLLANWGSGGAAGVPEPATLGLLAMGALALLRRRR